MDIVDEDSKLNDAVQTHGGKDWIAISVLVTDRTKQQCYHRWKDVLNSNVLTRRIDARVNGQKIKSSS
jgi:hypothetical protein